MKQVVVVGGNEIMHAIIAMLLRRESFRDRFIAGVYMIADDAAPEQDLKIRANVVHFDTEKAAREYRDTPDAKDAPQPTPKPEGAQA